MVMRVSIVSFALALFVGSAQGQAAPQKDFTANIARQVAKVRKETAPENRSVPIAIAKYALPWKSRSRVSPLPRRMRGKCPSNASSPAPLRCRTLSLFSGEVERRLPVDT